MNSLSLKVFMDSNAVAGAARSSLSGRLNCGVGDFDFVSRRQGLSWNYQARTFRMIACATERNSDGGGGGAGAGGAESESRSSGSFLSKSQTYALLKQQMIVAAKSEDYKEAARIRDSLKSLEKEEPILRLRSSMSEAIADERFEDAARYRDELKEIAPHCLLKCSSDATTLGIRVQVRSVFIEGRSQPSRGQYFFAYRIRITNNSTRPVQLLRRHWIITDAKERTENFWGIGIIGEQPVILPNSGFEYSSACPLTTQSGRMEGEFEMKHIDKVGSGTFNVAVAPFSLTTFGDGADTF